MAHLGHSCLRALALTPTYREGLGHTDTKHTGFQHGWCVASAGRSWPGFLVSGDLGRGPEQPEVALEVQLRGWNPGTLMHWVVTATEPLPSYTAAGSVHHAHVYCRMGEWGPGCCSFWFFQGPAA